MKSIEEIKKIITGRWAISEEDANEVAKEINQSIEQDMVEFGYYCVKNWKLGYTGKEQYPILLDNWVKTLQQLNQ